jgi:hypothetical protein
MYSGGEHYDLTHPPPRTQFKAFVACLGGKKAKELSRLRVFGRLFGLDAGNGVDKAKPYDEEDVDFFFKQLLPGIFPNFKNMEGVMNSKNRALDTDKVVKSIEEIFPNVHKKGGFQLAYMERKVEHMEQMKAKGIDFVNCDDVLELLFSYGHSEKSEFPHPQYFPPP